MVFNLLESFSSYTVVYCQLYLISLYFSLITLFYLLILENNIKLNEGLANISFNYYKKKKFKTNDYISSMISFDNYKNKFETNDVI